LKLQADVDKDMQSGWYMIRELVMIMDG